MRLVVALIFLFKQCHFLKVAYFQVIFSPFLQEKARFEVKVSGTGFPSFPYKGKFHLFSVCTTFMELHLTQKSDHHFSDVEIAFLCQTQHKLMIST